MMARHFSATVADHQAAWSTPRICSVACFRPSIDKCASFFRKPSTLPTESWSVTHSPSYPVPTNRQTVLSPCPSHLVPELATSVASEKTSAHHRPLLHLLCHHPASFYTALLIVCATVFSIKFISRFDPLSTSVRRSTALWKKGAWSCAMVTAGSPVFSKELGPLEGEILIEYAVR
jgi:hypothetical protein